MRLVNHARDYRGEPARYSDELIDSARALLDVTPKPPEGNKPVHQHDATNGRPKNKPERAPWGEWSTVIRDVIQSFEGEFTIKDLRAGILERKGRLPVLSFQKKSLDRLRKKGVIEIAQYGTGQHPHVYRRM